MASTTSTNVATSLSVATAQGSLLKLDTRGRVRSSKERRQAILAEFDRSGVSGAQFAKLTGLRYSTFAGWVSRHRKAKAGSKAATLAVAVPAFAPAVDGRAEAHPLPAAWATGRGAVTWFRARTPDGRVVYDGRVGTDAGADMVVNLDNVTPQASVSLAGLTYGEGDGDAWR